MVQKMKKLTTLFLLLICVFFAVSMITSQQQAKITPSLERMITEGRVDSTFSLWIFFKDKGPDLEQKKQAAQFALNSKALQRRLKHRSLEAVVDLYDVPVNDEYVKKVQDNVLRIRHRSRWLNAISVEADGHAIRLLAEYPFVKKIDNIKKFRFKEIENSTPVSNPPTISSQSATAFDYGPSFGQNEVLKIPAMHEKGFTGAGILICLLDTGFNNLQHEAIMNLDIVATWDFVNNDANVGDEDGQMGNGDHGTKVLGTMASFTPGTLIGPAYGASFLLAKTENSEYERHLEEDNWIAGAEWADENGADIINSSVGYRGDFTDGDENYTYEDMDGQTTLITLGANIAASRGILIVNAAGNEGMALYPFNTLIAPADSPLVIAVAATDIQGRRVEFSSMGPTFDGRIKPDFGVKGHDVLTISAVAVDKYVREDGTSFSCPQVAGVAALVLEANPSWTNLQIMDALRNTSSRADRPDNGVGWGMVNAEAAADFIPQSFLPPDDFTVKRLENDYIFFYEYVDLLSWSPNPRNVDPVASYRIYYRIKASQKLSFLPLTEVDNQTFTLARRGLTFDQEYIYKITAVSESGQESLARYVTY